MLSLLWRIQNKDAFLVFLFPLNFLTSMLIFLSSQIWGVDIPYIAILNIAWINLANWQAADRRSVDGLLPRQQRARPEAVLRQGQEEPRGAPITGRVVGAHERRRLLRPGPQGGHLRLEREECQQAWEAPGRQGEQKNFERAIKGLSVALAITDIHFCIFYLFISNFSRPLSLKYARRKSLSSLQHHFELWF